MRVGNETLHPILIPVQKWFIIVSCVVATSTFIYKAYSRARLGIFTWRAVKEQVQSAMDMLENIAPHTLRDSSLKTALEDLQTTLGACEDLVLQVDSARVPELKAFLLKTEILERSDKLDKSVRNLSLALGALNQQTAQQQQLREDLQGTLPGTPVNEGSNELDADEFVSISITSSGACSNMEGSLRTAASSACVGVASSYEEEEDGNPLLSCVRS